jgi:hypothetical protein
MDVAGGGVDVGVAEQRLHHRKIVRSPAAVNE